MTQEELEKLLNQKLALKHTNDADAWSDTAIAKYKDIEVSLFFSSNTTKIRMLQKCGSCSSLVPKVHFVKL
jgi:hypothetical protein